MLFGGREGACAGGFLNAREPFWGAFALAPLPGCGPPWEAGSGGVASLDHRLPSGMPPASTSAWLADLILRGF